MNTKLKNNNSVGVLFCSLRTNRHLFLLRSGKFTVWALPGGKVERNETLKQALKRECLEEISFWPENAKLFPIEQYTGVDDKFTYHTFYCMIDDEFIPTLNHEHIGYSWCDVSVHPNPLHSGLFNTLNYELIRQKIQIIHDSLK